MDIRTINKIQEIQEQCLEGILDVTIAVDQIDKEIGGITSVQFKTGKKFKIVNHSAMYPLPYETHKKRQELIHAIACLAYLKAQNNGSKRPGEIHISKHASTKHHRDGIYQIQKKYLH